MFCEEDEFIRSMLSKKNKAKNITGKKYLNIQYGLYFSIFTIIEKHNETVEKPTFENAIFR